MPGDSTDSRGHVTPESKNQRKTHLGEQKPHGRWEEPFPAVVMVPGIGTVSVHPHQTPSVPLPRAAVTKDYRLVGKNNTKVFSPSFLPRAQKSEIKVSAGSPLWRS